MVIALKYRSCQKLLAQKQNWDNDTLRMHFECGVCTGVGISNLVSKTHFKTFMSLAYSLENKSST